MIKKSNISINKSENINNEKEKNLIKTIKNMKKEEESKKLKVKNKVEERIQIAIENSKKDKNYNFLIKKNSGNKKNERPNSLKKEKINVKK